MHCVKKSKIFVETFEEAKKNIVFLYCGFRILPPFAPFARVPTSLLQRIFLSWSRNFRIHVTFYAKPRKGC